MLILVPEDLASLEAGLDALVDALGPVDVQLRVPTWEDDAELDLARERPP